jgi:hypothetical protein
MQGLEGAALMNYLLETWREEGPPVLLVEGFSGIGKSQVGNLLLRAWSAPKTFITIPSGGEDLESLLFDVAAALEVTGYSGVADAENGDFRKGFEQNFLRSGGLIVVDDIENELERSGNAVSSIVEFLGGVAAHAAPSRILLLSSISPQADQWPTAIPIKTMAPPSPSRAQQLLHELLLDRGLEGEVPTDKMSEVAQWLGNNPRAMQAFVACLIEDPLDELIQLDDDAWERRDDAPSPSLVRRLEVLFLTKTLDRLPADATVLLENLSVYRKPVTLEAMEAISPGQLHTMAAKDELQRRFLMHRDRKWYSLNPVARELAHSRLRKNVRSESRAHSLAADFFGKRAKPSNGRSVVVTGADFIEAKYHLHKSGRTREYEDLAASHRDLLLQNYRNVRDLPTDAREKEFLLATLGSILDKEDWSGYSKLRSLLARLLVERNAPRDALRALRQITLCCRDSRNVSDWLLRAELVAANESHVALRALAAEAVDFLATTNALSVLLRLANLLSNRGQDQAAFELISEQMSVFPRSERQPLYTAAAFALVRAAQPDYAIEYLLRGYGDVAASGRNRHRLFEEALFLAFQRRDRKSIERIRSMVMSDGLNEYQSHLCEALLCQLRGDYASATLSEVRRGKYFALDCQVAFAYLCNRDAASAAQALSAGRRTANSATLWLEGLIALCRGNAEVHERAMRKSAESIGLTIPEVDSRTWLLIWDQDPPDLDPFPAFYFPVLPSNLTGLSHDLSRLPGSHVFASVNCRALDLPVVASERLAERSSGTTDEVRLIVNNINGNYMDGAIMGSTYNVGQAGAVGDNAAMNGGNLVYVADQTDQSRILSELTALMASMKAADPNDVEVVPKDIEHVSAAVAELESGDMVAAHGKLAKLGLATLQFARDIGVEVAAAVIQRAMGIV